MRRLVTFCAAYIALSFVGAALRAPGYEPVVWAPSGLLTGLLLLFEACAWPLYLAAALPLEMIARLSITASQPSVAVASSISIALASAFGAWTTRAHTGPFRLTGLRETLTLCGVCAVVAPGMGAAIFDAMLAPFGQTLAGANFFMRWTSQATGVLCFAPLALVLWRPNPQWRTLNATNWAEVGAMLFSAVAISDAVFRGVFPFAYVLLPILLWASIRLEMLGAAVFNFSMAIVAIAHTLRGNGMFADPRFDMIERQWLTQLYLLAMALSALVVAAITHGRRRALQSVQRANMELERRVAERTSELRQSEERLRMALSAAKMEAFEFSPRTEKIRRVGEVVSQPDEQDPKESEAAFFARVHPDDRRALRAAIASATPALPDYTVEYRFRAPDGQWRWITDRAKMLFDDKGQQLRAFGVLIDNSERKQAENALRLSEERFSAIVRSAMDAIIALDSRQQVLLFNAAAETMFGWKAQDAIGQPIDLFIPIRFRKAHRRHIRFFGDSGATTRAMGKPGAISGLRANGEEFPIEASIAQFSIGDDHIYTVILRDITERKRAEDALRASEARFAGFMQHLPGLAWIKTAEGRYAYVNDAAGKAFRKSRDELYGKTDAEIFPADTAAHFVAHDREALASESGVVTVETLEQDDGVLHHSLVSKFPMWNGGGSPIGVGGVAIDITERVIAERKLLEATDRLREADRRKDEFLATLAHELRNPLAPIRNGLHVLRLSGPRSESIIRLQSIMERQVDHLVRLVDDLLEVSRISRGKITLKRQRVDLVPVVQEAIEMSRQLVESEGLELIVSAPRAPIMLVADPVRLTQIFANILNNAAKYTNRGGRVEIRVEQLETEARVSVADTGIGISAEMLPRVFDLFAQVDRTLSRARGGLGIGLALVRNLVELHGGAVSAHSEGEGRGSRFTVRLPLAPDDAPPPSSRDAPDGMRSNRVDAPRPRRKRAGQHLPSGAELKEPMRFDRRGQRGSRRSRAIEA